MIEMRWIIVSAGSGRGLIGGSDSQMYESVLQFRHHQGTVFHTDEKGTVTGMSSTWSDWKDAAPPGKLWPSGG